MKRRLIPALALMVAMMLGEGNAVLAAGDSHEAAPAGEQLIQRKQFQKMAVRLKLTDTQREQIKALFNEARTKNKPLRDTLIKNRQQMRQLIEADSFDETAAKALATEEATTHAELALARARLFHQVRAVLTPEQRELAKRLKPTMDGRKKFHRPVQQQ